MSFKGIRGVIIVFIVLGFDLVNRFFLRLLNQVYITFLGISSLLFFLYDRWHLIFLGPMIQFSPLRIMSRARS